MKRSGFWIFLLALIVGAGWFWWPRGGVVRWPPAPQRLVLTRPYGMAPQAFHAFVRACHGAKIHPWRIGQTIGNHPRSHGYHFKDGSVPYQGEPFDYCAAVDLGTSDLTPRQIEAFLEALAQQGFASFYRHGARWQGNEHIHAIYAQLPMKPQLRRQVRQFLRERRAARKPKLKWMRRWKS
jgi:hypothetical protein